ncbi:MAG: hypothetical protein WBN86_10165 [Porticoccaceae bacterium]
MQQDVRKLIAEVCKESRTIGHANAQARGDALRSYELYRLSQQLFLARERSFAYSLGFHAGIDLQSNHVIPHAPFARWTDQAREYAQGICDAVGTFALIAFHPETATASAEGGE